MRCMLFDSSSLIKKNFKKKKKKFPFRSIDSISQVFVTLTISDPYFGTAWALILVMIEQVISNTATGKCILRLSKMRVTWKTVWITFVKKASNFVCRFQDPLVMHIWRRQSSTESLYCLDLGCPNLSSNRPLVQSHQFQYTNCTLMINFSYLLPMVYGSISVTRRLSTLLLITHVM